MCGTPGGGTGALGPVFDVDVLSNNNVVIGVNSGSNGQLLVRDPITLGPASGTPGGGTVLGPITAIAVNSLDQVAVGTSAGQLLLRDGSGGLGPVSGTPGGGTMLSPIHSLAIQSDNDIAVGTLNSLLLRVGSGGLGPVVGTPGGGTNFGQPVTALAIQSDDDIVVGLTHPNNIQGQLLLRQGSGGLGPAAGSPGGGVVFSHGIHGLAVIEIPEPSTLVLLLGGIVGCLWRSGRSRACV